MGLIGGCCGSTAEYIAAMRKAIDELSGEGELRSREVTELSGCTSGTHVDYRQENSFLIVGERMNASKPAPAVLIEDWTRSSLGRDQTRLGANVLDVNVDYAGRDNAADMAAVVGRVVNTVNAPLMIDSTQIATLEGTPPRGNKSIINSATSRTATRSSTGSASSPVGTARDWVISSIDEDEESAMARERKVAIARRARDRAVEKHGLDPADLMFDPLVLPISTGMDSDRRSGLELVDAVREIALTIPECQITCGLSNCSFGLKPAARKVLNSVFLHELTEAGMTSAIVHAGGILPLARIPDEQAEAALDLIYDRRDVSVGEDRAPRWCRGPRVRSPCAIHRAVRRRGARAMAPRRSSNARSRVASVASSTARRAVSPNVSTRPWRRCPPRGDQRPSPRRDEDGGGAVREHRCSFRSCCSRPRS